MGSSKQMARNARRPAAVALLLLALVTGVVSHRASAAISPDAFEQCLLEMINADRAAAGAPTLVMAENLNHQVRDWSEWMRYNTFRHMTDAERAPILPDSWTTWGENVAWHSNPGLADCAPIHQMLMDSPGHRANILGSSFRFAALGAYVDGSGWWVTELFFDADDYSPLCSGTFCDDEDSIFQVEIEKVAADGITNGCSSTSFCPEEDVTRGQMAAFLTRALDLPEGSAIEFTDDGASGFEDEIERIAAAGITEGCNPPNNDRFCPDDYVTRGQMAAFLTRALDLTEGSAIEFTDDGASGFEDEIERIAAAGITYGCNPPDNDRFCPYDYVTREQMAAFLTRALDL